MKYRCMLFLLIPWVLNGQALFTKVTDQSNPVVSFTNTGAPYKGAVWIDLDDDNLPDLFASQQFLFHNDGNGQFSRLTDVNGATLGQAAAGSSWGDIDNDGYPECITASLISGLQYNNGSQTFTPSNNLLPGLGSFSAWDCALADIDNNGRLDVLFVHANGFHATGPHPCRLYLQASDGTFSPVSGYEFTDQLAPYTIPIWADYDLDGDMDLFIGAGPAGTPGPDYCYKNMLIETGSFSLNRLSNAPFDALQDGQTYNFPDYDNDGDLDICLTNYAGASNRFWRNDNGTYVAVTTPFTVQNSHLSNVWGDVDNDGDQDVLITSDVSALVRLYRNNGDGTFGVGKIAGFTANNICGIALADYDNDGDLDFFTNGALEGRGLFRNDTLANNRNWAILTLQGNQSNRSAIGATIRVKANLNGQSTWQIRQVQAHNSFQGQNDLRQHFGLQTAAVLDSVEVSWPSGQKQVFANLAANNFYKIIEGQGVNILTQTKALAKTNNIRVHPNPLIGDILTISLDDQAPVIQSTCVFDQQGRQIAVTTQQQKDGWQLQFPKKLVAGTYYLRMNSKQGITNTQVIIKQ